MSTLHRGLRVVWGAVLLIVLFVLSSTEAKAQVLKAQILGSVNDSSGALVPNAKVALLDVTKGVRTETETNDSGSYVFINLDPGVYEVSVEHQGFSRAVRGGIDLQPNSTVRVNFDLVPGSVNEVVQVDAAAPLLQTDRADTGGKIEQIQLQNMPLLFNRNYQGLLLLVPGVGRPFRPHSVFYNSQDSLAVRVNGQGRQYNNFQIEGIENKIDNGNLTALVPPAEAIQTVDLSTSNFDPEFGNAGGAVTNVTLRSGSNDFHGSVFHFHRNENIQARNTFAVTKAPTVYNQFGGTLGGRIVRDKMFIFGDYQGSRDRLGQVNRVVMPGLAFRRGDLSASPTRIYDPQTGDPVTGRGRTPFPGNVIPENRISPIAKKIVGFLPDPNVNAAEGQINYDRNTVLSKDMNQFDIKYDWVISTNDRLAVRYSYQKATVFDPGLYGPDAGIYGGPHGDGFSGRGPARTQSPGITFSKVFSPTFVWESRFGIIRNRNDALSQDHGLTTSQDIGVRGANLEAWSSGIVEVRVDGYSRPVIGFSPSLPWARSVTSFGFVNNFSKTLTKHILRFGVDLRRERNDLLQTQTFNPRGRFEYAAGQTGSPDDTQRGFANAFAAFLLDVPNQSGRDLPVQFPTRRERNLNLYFQDKWQVSSRLTVDLGLRYEIQFAGRPRFKGNYSNYNYLNNTLELAGYGDIPMNLGVKTYYNNFGPRVGFSYRPTDKWVVRSGFGVSFIPRRTAQNNFPVLQNDGWPAPNAFVTSVVSMTTGFPAPAPAVLPENGIITNPPGTQSYGTTPRDVKVPYVMSWNFAIQRQLPGNIAAEAAYVGNKGVSVQTGWNVNAGMVPGLGNNGRPLFRQFGRVGDTITYLGLNTWYHSLQTKIDRRFHNGLMVTGAYTFSKGLNYEEDNENLLLNLNVALAKGRMADNRTHVFTTSFLYDLPIGRGKPFLSSGIASWIFGNWQVQGIVSLMSGTWVTPIAPASTLNAPGNQQRADLVGDVRYPREYGPGGFFFDKSAFTVPAQNTFGSAGRNIIEGPSLLSLDSSVFREFPIREGHTLTLRVEAFNTTNTPHYNTPERDINSPQFGRVVSAMSDQRQFQLALTYRF
ncbi:MAG TPA: TonB-dependent receptor [Bryobacteraceae bacterium]|nr:TonB-dependent receptor [Bryobacteraceae bacterium]